MEIDGGADTVRDFDVSEDVLILDGQIFDAKADGNNSIASNNDVGLIISHKGVPGISDFLEGVTLAELVSGVAIQPDGNVNWTDANDTIGLS